MKKSVEAINVLSSAKKENLFPLDKKAAWNYFCAYQKAGIDPVGVVTVAFWPFQTVMYAVRSYITVKSWEESEAKRAKLATLSETLNILFSWLKNELCVGSEFTEKSAQYISPVCCAVSKHGPEVDALCTRTGYKALRRARRMAFNPSPKEIMAANCEISEEEKLTLTNVLLFCQDMEKVGRMSQEGTIDAAKTSISPAILKTVVRHFMFRGQLRAVTLIEALRKVKLLSRRGDFSLAFDFEGSTLELKKNEAKSFIKTKKGKTSYVVYDMLEEVRQEALANAITSEMTQKVLGFNQTLPESEMEAYSRAMSRHTDKVVAIRCLMNMFRDIRDAQDNAVIKTRECFGRDEAMVSANVSVIRDVTKKAYNALTSMAISILKGDKESISNEEMIRLVLGVTMEYMAKDATRPSSFVGIILEEQFMEYIMSLYAQDYPELMLTRDELAYCEAEDGEEVEFVNGIVPGRKIFSLEKNAIPDGMYTVRKSGKKAYVEAKMRDRLEMRIAEKYDANTLIFQTMPIADEHKADKILKAINGGKEVVLMGQVATLPRNSQYNVVVVDNKAIENFQAKVKDVRRNEEGELETRQFYNRDSWVISRLVSDFCANKTGKVAFAQKISFGNKFAVLVVLEDTRHVFKKPGEIVDAMAAFNTPVKKVNARATLGALSALMKEDAPAKPEPAANPVSKPSLRDLLTRKSQPVKSETEQKTPGRSRLAALARMGAEE